MSRWKASAIHLVISASIAAMALVLFLLLWYPPPLFQADGGFRLLRTILIVDVVLGPLLTLVVFKSGKKGLKFDLWVIGTLQVAALVFGMNVAFQARPAWIAVMPHRATVIHANEVYEPEKSKRYAHAPLWGPEPVAVREAESEEERQALFDDFFAGLPDIDYRPARYLPLEEGMDAITAEAEPLQQRMDRSLEAAAFYHDWLADRERVSAEGMYVLPLLASVEELEIVLDARDASIVGYVMPPEES